MSTATVGIETIPIILNGKAGATHESIGEEQLRRMARDAGFKAKIVVTHTVEEMRATIRQMVKERLPKVAIAGGDGTVAAAVQELAHTNTALGILAQGTYNNFATAMRLPHNLPKALKTLHEGRVCSIDLGRVGDLFFTESAGVGLFADGLAALGQEQHHFLNHLYSAFRVLLSLHANTMEITVDGQTCSHPVALCEVANTYRIGPGMPIAPEAELEDGLFDVVLIGEIHHREVPEYLNAIHSQLHLDLPKVTQFRAGKEVKITSRRRRNVHCDDSVVAMTPVTIHMEAGALQVLVDDSR